MSYLLSINAGSSSLKATLFEFKNLKTIESYHFTRVKDHQKCLEKIHQDLKQKNLNNLKAIAHRVVHGGEKYKDCTLITTQVENEIKKLSPLAPLHNPINLTCIKLAKKLFKCAHFAVFDTGFFNNIPEKAYLYGIPTKYYHDDKIRKYGFHGINHKYIYEETKKLIKTNKPSGIICHLGNGCSISAIKNGKAIDTSMGFTPLDGVIMGTRSGSIDPGIILYLQKKYPRLNIEKLLQEKSGLLGLSQISNHMRDIYLEARKGDKQCQATIDAYCYKISSYVGFYANLLPDLDFITFTGGVGENAQYVRNKVTKNLPGLIMDFSKIFVIPANENYQMASETKSKISKKD